MPKALARRGHRVMVISITECQYVEINSNFLVNIIFVTLLVRLWFLGMQNMKKPKM